MLKVCVWEGGRKLPAPRTFSPDNKVADVKNYAAEILGAPPTELSVLHCGRQLSSDASIGLNGNATLHVVRRKQGSPTSTSGETLPGTMEEIEGLVTSLQTALNDPQHRNLLFSIISNSEGLANLISATPGLKEDTVAQGVLKDPYLVMHWLISENASEVIKSHPCLLEAGRQIMSSLHQEATQGVVAVDASMIFDEDGDSGDEREQQEEEGARAARHPPAGGITQNQLAQALALAAAGGAGGAGPSRAPAPAPAAAAAARPPAFTPDMLQRAVASAFAAAGATPPPASPQQPDHAEAFSQLESMGFTNREENVAALRATGGNFEAALEHIISAREQMEK